jgi:hypothetical protein
MSRFILHIQAVLKIIDPTPPPVQILTPPKFIVQSSSPEEVRISILRKDSSGTDLRWEIGTNADLTGNVIGIDQQEGILTSSGIVTLTNNGLPITSFYIRVRDTNRPNYRDGIAPISFVQIDEVIQLDPVPFVVTPIDTAVQIHFVPVQNTLEYGLDISTDNSTWTLVTNSMTQNPFTVNGLVNGTLYYFRLRGTANSIAYRDSESFNSGTPPITPVLPVPLDLIFDDLGSGNVSIDVVNTGPVPDNYVIQRDGIEVYSGATLPTAVAGFSDATSYAIRIKTQKTGHLDSGWYSETYLHQVAPVTWLTLEQFGGNPYYKRFDEGLLYTPLSNGTTRITKTGAFSALDEGKRFCGLFAKKNPNEIDLTQVDVFYPSIIGSRYSTVTQFIDSSNIIVDFDYMAHTGKGYIFFDNSKAWKDMWDAFQTSPYTEIRITPHTDATKVFVIPGITSVSLPTNKETRIWTGSTSIARIKPWMEDYFQWEGSRGTRIYKQGLSLFLPTISNHNFISHNIYWLPPHRRVKETQTINTSFFGGQYIGLQNRILTVINCQSLEEQREIGLLATEETFTSTGFGFMYSGGQYSGTGILEDTTDYMYVLMKNFEHKGNNIADFKANSGGGLFYVAEDVTTDFLDKGAFNPAYFPATVKVTTDYSGFKPDIQSRSYYPDTLLELTSDNSFYQTANMYSTGAWANAGSCVQIGGFVFWTLGFDYWRNTFESWYNRGDIKRTWFGGADGGDFMTSSKVMMHTIPVTGQTYTIGRHYDTTGKAITSTSANVVRGHINWAAVLNKRASQVVTADVPANCIPLEFQPGDRFTIVGQGATIYKVIRTERGDYPNWSDEINTWSREDDKNYAYYFSKYFLDRDLPAGLPLTFQIAMVESKAEVLLDGVARSAYVIFKYNFTLTSHNESTDMTDGNIVASDPFGHVNYCHKELTFWGKNYLHKGDWRQSSNSRPTPFQITINGQATDVKSLRGYSKGYTMINSSGFVRQFNPVSQFEIRDLIRKSQGINLTENLKEKVRLYNCTGMNNLENTPGPYLEVYATDAGAPDMPTPCRALLDSLPN